MRIDPKLFDQFVDLPPGISRDVGLSLVHNRYCSILSLKNKCPKKCASCRPLLHAIFEMGYARTPSGALRWRIDNVIAGKVSIWISPTKKPVKRLDRLGVQVSEDPFSELVKALA
jgi:hypothetical protein